ncbi:antibiotic biosynthesis monooxygenase [Pseudonocardia kujensis]|uniref:putative quinol monooxygenase n=1 Tax=Pseudonocardia kujensis TaxID=1128675 RepID=UPI001E2B0F92|nr:putative quinol monooxygenase [Pseudonocardia kujensis]MCE0765562.1 antibiotic biosynthesis monooxygenase [Pseudonocardia kujensis]
MSGPVSAELLASTRPVAFFGYADPKPGLERDLRERMLALGDPSRAEPGVLAYEVHEAPSRPGSVAFYEVYRDGNAVRAHLEQPHMREFFADSAALLAGDLDIHVLHPILAEERGEDRAGVMRHG